MTQNKSNKPAPLELIPNGIYRAVLTAVDFGESRNKRPMYSLSWEITDGDYIGRKIKSFIVTDSSRTKNIIKVIIINMGFDPEEVSSLNQLVNYECRIKIVKTNTSYGTINSVDFYYNINA